MHSGTCVAAMVPVVLESHKLQHQQVLITAVGRRGQPLAPLKQPTTHKLQSCTAVILSHDRPRLQEEEAELQELEATMAACAAALADRGAMPSQRDLTIIAAGADHATEEYAGARRADRPWWDGRERRVWQREVDDAGTPAAIAYLLAALLAACKRLVDAA